MIVPCCTILGVGMWLYLTSNTPTSKEWKKTNNRGGGLPGCLAPDCGPDAKHSFLGETRCSKRKTRRRRRAAKSSQYDTGHGGGPTKNRQQDEQSVLSGPVAGSYPWHRVRGGILPWQTYSHLSFIPYSSVFQPFLHHGPLYAIKKLGGTPNKIL